MGPIISGNCSSLFQMSSFEMEALFKLESGCIGELKHAHLHPHKKSVGLFARYAILSVLYKNKKNMIFFSSDNKSKSWLRWNNIIYNGILLKSEGEWKLGPGQVIFSMIKICKNKSGMSRKIIIIVYTVQLSFHFMPQPFKFTYWFNA